MQKRKYIYHSSQISKKHKKAKDESDSEDEDEKEKGIGIGMLKSLLNSKVDSIGNHIWFNDDVTGDSVSKLIKVINARNFLFEQKQREIFYGKLEPKPLYLHINSDGGEIHEGMAAVDCIRNSKIPIYTIIEGRAASAATFMSIAGKKRYITENSVLLIHQLSSGMWGKMTELEDEHENNKFFMEKIYSIYSKYTTVPKKELKNIMKRDIWWDSEKALKYGFVDEIFTSTTVDEDNN
jgi:ATP-dependent Clp endopeptidase proteolytic subunit ClpP